MNRRVLGIIFENNNKKYFEKNNMYSTEETLRNSDFAVIILLNLLNAHVHVGSLIPRLPDMMDG